MSKEPADPSLIRRLRAAATEGARPVCQTVAPTAQQIGTAWREAAGRSDGTEGYQFGDLSRSLMRGAKSAADRTRLPWLLHNPSFFNVHYFTLLSTLPYTT